MIASWMAYTVGASLLLALAALALEHGLSLHGVPRRWAWAGALLGSLFLALIPWALPSRSPTNAVSPGEPVALQEPHSAVGNRQGTALRQPITGPSWLAIPGRVAPPSWRRMDQPLLLTWTLLSTLGVLFLAGTHRRLRRRRRAWKPTRVDGVPALLSKNTGPAVVGFLDSAIVVPEWVFALDEARRRFVVAHEEEHLRAGDPRLLATAFAALVLMPWNAALWWQVYRLRHAVELDCDARVMARYPDPRTYGTLLVEIGQRAAGYTVVLAAFSESSSFLERRIRAMYNRKPRGWRALAGGSAMLALLLITLACELPQPTTAELAPRLAEAAEGPAVEREAKALPAAGGVRAGTLSGAPDTLVLFLENSVVKLRVRKPEEEPHTLPQTCGHPLENDMGELWWPNCGGYKLYGDGTVMLAQVHPVVGRMVVGGPAWNAGLRSGDVLLSVDEYDARMVVGPFRNLRSESKEGPFRVRVRRGTQERELEFTVTPSWISQRRSGGAPVAQGG